MANEFIRLGNRAINLANVERILYFADAGGEYATIQYTSGKLDRYESRDASEEIKALRRWVDAVTPDLLAEPVPTGPVTMPFVAAAHVGPKHERND